ncbi:MAG TPA: prepilin-type N-terminal cleavage/methylation domain-containing protein [Methylocella sp.]|nr:prepilin-type N-terminal cleavage/methylation domain-containing protein [Methylocella sp.]
MTERAAESGFTLLETVCVLAIIAMLAAVVLPAIPHATSRTALEAYALKTAALLKGDRNTAVRTGATVETELSTLSRTIRSGASGRVVQLPADVTFNAILAEQCGGHASGAAIEFLPSGMSCGGTIFLSRPGAGFEIRITWLTGGIEVVPANVL